MVNLKNPLFLSTAILSILIYSGILKIKERNPYKSLFDASKISKIEGTIDSNPSLTEAFGGSYSCDLKLSAVSTLKSEKSQAYGTVKIYIPRNFVESLYPEKLFTSGKSNLKNENNLLIESGANVIFSVAKTFTTQSGGSAFKNPSFVVENIEKIWWNENVFGKIKKFRSLSRLHFKRLMSYWGEAGGFFLALLSGSREYTDKKIQDAFSKSGLSHIMALSGIYLSLFSGIVLFIGKKILTKKLSAFLHLFSIVAFVWFAGVYPSLIRAFFCALIIFVNEMLRMKKIQMTSVLCLSFLIQGIIFPSHLMNAGFILSYAALFGILIFSPAIKNLLNSHLFPYLSSSFSTSLSAQLFTCPVSIKLFNSVATAGVIAAMVASPVVTLFIYCGVAGFILSLSAPFLRRPIRAIILVIYLVIKKLVLFFSTWPVLNFQ